MNEDQWESIADLLAAATEPLTPKKRRAVLKRIREEFGAESSARFFGREYLEPY